MTEHAPAATEALPPTKEPLIILAGPTAVGKTALSIALAKAVDGEIVSADSMQVYRHMDIGSAKIKEEERCDIPHHLIDVLEPTQDCNVHLFQQMAREAITGVLLRGRLPILVGGTGFYIQSILYDIHFSEEEEDGAYRRSLEELADREGSAALHLLLTQVDPESAALIHPNNRKRIIRALEYAHLTGDLISRHNREERSRQSAYKACYFVFTLDRAKLYERIDSRVDQMMRDGLLDEVRHLRQLGCTRGMTSMQGLGYKELYACLEGELALDEAVRLIKQNTRHFAKRQLTWFRREPDAIWVDLDEYPSTQAVLSLLLDTCRARGLPVDP